MALAFGGFQIDNQAAVLDRDHLRHSDHTGFGVDLGFRHLHATDAAIGEVGWFGAVRILAAYGERHGSELRTGLLPGQRLARVAFHSNGAVDAFKIGRLRVQRGRDLREQRVTSIHRSAPGRRTNATNGGGTSRTARWRIHRVADQKID